MYLSKHDKSELYLVQTCPNLNQSLLRKPILLKVADKSCFKSLKKLYLACLSLHYPGRLKFIQAQTCNVGS